MYVLLVLSIFISYKLLESQDISTREVLISPIALAGTIRPLSPIKTLASIGIANKGTDMGNAAARAVGGNNAALNMTLRAAMSEARRIKSEPEEREAPEATVSIYAICFLSASQRVASA